ncbi:MAG: hypothetical protein O3A53_09495 [Acidobacteria bacterium]|nr:hypothetical protein [Acidobacteriota bacterium]
MLSRRADFNRDILHCHGLPCASSSEIAARNCVANVVGGSGLRKSLSGDHAASTDSASRKHEGQT